MWSSTWCWFARDVQAPICFYTDQTNQIHHQKLCFFVFIVEAPWATQGISLGFIKILHDLCSSESNRTESNTWVNLKKCLMYLTFKRGKKSEAEKILSKTGRSAAHLPSVALVSIPFHHSLKVVQDWSGYPKNKFCSWLWVKSCLVVVQSWGWTEHATGKKMP